MIHQALADLLVVIHGLVILFILMGGVLVLWCRWVAWIHIPFAAWGVLVESMGWGCPLTPLENHLRRAGGSGGYEGGFIEHYLIPVIYPSGLTPEIQLGLALLVLTVNVGMYSIVLLRWRAKRALE